MADSTTTTAPATSSSRNLNEGFLDQYGTTDAFAETSPEAQITGTMEGTATEDATATNSNLTPVTSNSERRANKTFGSRFDEFAGGTSETSESSSTASAETETSSASASMLEANYDYDSESSTASDSGSMSYVEASFSDQKYAPGKNKYS